MASDRGRRTRPATRILSWLPAVLFLAGGLALVTRSLDRSDPPGLPPLTIAEADLARNLESRISVLAGEIGERNLWRYGALEASRRYIAGELAAMDYAVSLQEFTAEGKQVFNLGAEHPGRDLPGEIILLGAHYDSVTGCPGANDNASGVAAVLELARLLRGTALSRTVRFVFFVNEEPPFFKSDRMGSRVYARRSAERGEKIVAMFSLETVGYFRDEPGSQTYPFPLGLIYPDVGNYIGFVGNIASRGLLRQVLGSFRETSPFPAEGVAAPGLVPGIDWSDHWSFWKEGYPALMVTDTALYRYPHYHTADDTPDKVDPERLARVVAGLSRVVQELAGPATQR